MARANVRTFSGTSVLSTSNSSSLCAPAGNFILISASQGFEALGEPGIGRQTFHGLAQLAGDGRIDIGAGGGRRRPDFHLLDPYVARDASGKRLDLFSHRCRCRGEFGVQEGRTHNAQAHCQSAAIATGVGPLDAFPNRGQQRFPSFHARKIHIFDCPADNVERAVFDSRDAPVHDFDERRSLRAGLS